MAARPAGTSGARASKRSCCQRGPASRARGGRGWRWSRAGCSEGATEADKLSAGQGGGAREGTTAMIASGSLRAMASTGNRVNQPSTLAVSSTDVTQMHDNAIPRTQVAGGSDGAGRAAGQGPAARRALRGCTAWNRWPRMASRSPWAARKPLQRAGGAQRCVPSARAPEATHCPTSKREALLISSSPVGSTVPATSHPQRVCFAGLCTLQQALMRSRAAAPQKRLK